MKKVFLAIVFVSAFSLLFKGTSNASSLEVFSFTGHITEDGNYYDPVFPKNGDKFAGLLSYVYDPMLKPVSSDPNFIYEPENSYTFYFDDFTMTGSADFTLGYFPAGGMDFFSTGASGAPFGIEDIYIHIGELWGNFDILPTNSSGHIIGFLIQGTMDSVSYSSIPMNSQPVPEPASFILLGFGLLGYVGSRYKCKKK